MIRLCGHAQLHRLRTDWLDVVLCHEGNIEDPSVYLEGFEALVDEGRVRAYGISTNSLDVLKRFNVNGTCSVVQVDYSLLNRAPEAEFLPYCQANDIGVMVRGPLAMGLLSGRYSTDTVFTDSVRANWHANDESQARADRASGQGRSAQAGRSAGRRDGDRGAALCLQPSGRVAGDPGGQVAGAGEDECGRRRDERCWRMNWRRWWR